MYQAFVAGHINKSQNLAIRQRRIGIAQLDGDTAFFFFFQTVGIHTRQGADQGGFAVVDMSCSTNNHACSGISCALKAASKGSSRQRKSSQKASCAMRPMTGWGKVRRRFSS